MKILEYRQCKRCVMDTTDSLITFNSKGECCHCENFDNVTSKRWFPNEEGKKLLEIHFERIRREGRGKEYDCIIGLSGGIDSSYLAIILKDFHLRPLVMHVDAGWNSEIAVANIEKIVKHCNYDLFTHVVDWTEIKDLQLAYLRAGVANQDVPQDHAFFAAMYHFAVKNNITHLISGGNIASESVVPKSWHHSAMDAINLKAIHKKFGNLPLNNFTTISFFQYYIYFPFFKKMKTLLPLNYIPYNKSAALKALIERIGYKEYGRKHGESRFTKFFQNYYLPMKFGFDKRKIHLSSLILSGQITRDDALKKLQEPLYDPFELSEDRCYVAKKLGISEDELESFIRCPGRSYKDFDNWDFLYNIFKRSQSFVEKLAGKQIKNYSR